MSSDDLWAVAAYFNPARYDSRLTNYKVFRQQLNVPLVVAEASTGEEFDLRPDDADIVVQVGRADAIWHKEQLLALAVEAVPKTVRKIAWLDCDIVFERDDWAAEAVRLLEDFSLVQLYSELVREPKGCLPGRPDFPLRGPTRPSFASFPDGRTDPLRVLLEQPRRPGMTFPGPVGGAWACRRSLFDEIGLYGAGVLGGGDSVAMAAVCGAWEVAFRHMRMTPAAREHYMAWAEPFQETVGGRLGCVDGQLYHLWHGDESKRGYGNRYQRLAEYSFDPSTDITLGPDGLYRWGSDKPSMHAFVRDYFGERREDT